MEPGARLTANRAYPWLASWKSFSRRRDSRRPAPARAGERGRDCPDARGGVELGFAVAGEAGACVRGERPPGAALRSSVSVQVAAGRRIHRAGRGIAKACSGRDRRLSGGWSSGRVIAGGHSYGGRQTAMLAAERPGGRRRAAAALVPAASAEEAGAEAHGVLSRSCARRRCSSTARRIRSARSRNCGRRSR